MAITVNSNISSLNAQRNLTTNASTLNRTLSRLSSGKRINSASDDAAGLAISEGFKSQIKGMNQAVRNANDGLSLMGVAEASLNEQTNVLQRIRELAVQAANDTNSSSNRTSLNNEVSQLAKEFDRIAKTTQFNGINLLDGSFSSKDLQVGANSGSDQKFSISLDSSRSSDVGKLYKAAGTTGTSSTAMSAATDVKIQVGGTSYDLGVPTSDGVSTSGGATSALAYKSAIDDLGLGMIVEAKTTYSNAAQTAGTLNDTNYVTINGVDIKGVTTTAASDTDIAEYITSHVDGVTATVDSSNKLVLTAEDGRNITVAAAGTGATITGLAAGTYQGKLTITGGSSFTVTQNATDFMGLGATTVSASQDTTANVSQLDVTTKDNANKAIMIVDFAIDSLNSQRSTIGAQTSRLNSVVSTLSAAVENVTAANSRIVDADFASETAELSKSQILQQAAVSVLAQANQTPQVALSLLQ
ncbi:MAG: flagellin [Candidatus Sumerlaeia bacterium]